MNASSFPPVIVENGEAFVIIAGLKYPLQVYINTLNRHQKRAFLADLKKRSKKAILRRADTVPEQVTEENTIAIENAGTPAEVEDAVIVPNP